MTETLSPFDIAFLVALLVVLAAVLAWGFRYLPGERGQFLAAIPLRRDPGGPSRWTGVNLTVYGSLTATAQVFGLLVFLILLMSEGIPRDRAVALGLVLLGAGAAAASLLARLVEGRRYTLTVGGASFAVVLIVPPLVHLSNRLLGGAGPEAFSPQAVLAATVIAFCFGEGLGRLACLSFGCCYGRPLHETDPILRRLFAGRCFRFQGPTKKVAFEGGLEGREVLPIQSVTSIVLLSFGWIALCLFLAGLHRAALITAGVSYHGWRVLSEHLRADYRGGGRWSAYQTAGLAAVLWILLWSGMGAADLGALEPSAPRGLRPALASLWDAGMVLMLEAVWLALFLAAGLSRVTSVELRFGVREDRA